MFNLEFLSGPERGESGTFAWGRITLGSVQEEFQAPLQTWTAADYERQWLQAAARLTGGALSAVFVTHTVHPKAAYHIGWPAWREDDRVYVQERLFLSEQLPGPFEADRAETYVGTRAEVSEEGNPISQWQVRLSDVAAYVERCLPRVPAQPAHAADGPGGREVPPGHNAPMER